MNTAVNDAPPRQDQPDPLLSAYRCPETVATLAQQIHQTATQPWTIMEVCGGQTNSIVRYGLDQLLSPAITFIHGPGCPVCVTPAEIITHAITLAQRPNTMLCTFGDMLRVPTGDLTRPQTLLTAKAQGAQVRAIYSPEEAVTLAEQTPSQTIVLLAVGFETTTPATALAAMSAKAKGLSNFFMLVSHVRVPPALAALTRTADHQIDALLAAGHVCTIMGTQEYDPLVQRSKLPIVVTGFEPVDILRGVLAAVKQLEDSQYALENQYPRYVQAAGNTAAQQIINTVYQTQDQRWRGLGKIARSGWQFKPEYQYLDATQLLNRPQTHDKKTPQPTDCDQAPAPAKSCQAGAVLTGKLKPCDCPHFGTACQPKHPLGAPMVSDEGACAAYFHHRRPTQAAASPPLP